MLTSYEQVMNNKKYTTYNNKQFERKSIQHIIISSLKEILNLIEQTD